MVKTNWLFKMIKNIFLYHNNCDDGFGAAWAAWKKFGKRGKYIGVNHGDPYPEDLEGKNVYLLDFSYPPEITKELLKKTAHLAIIDHHKTAKDSVKLIKDSLYKMNHSGAVLSWIYFHPKKKVPNFLQYIEDADLWNWKLAHGNELMASLETVDFDFKVWDKLAADWNTNHIKRYIEKGKTIVKYQKELIKHAVAESLKVEFCGYKTYAVNFNGALVSQIGHALYEKFPPIAIVWSAKGDKIVISLRSNGKVDVSKLAAKFGGGGHKAAAGFRIGLNEKFPWKIISSKK